MEKPKSFLNLSTPVFPSHELNILFYFLKFILKQSNSSYSYILNLRNYHRKIILHKSSQTFFTNSISLINWTHFVLNEWKIIQLWEKMKVALKLVKILKWEWRQCRNKFGTYFQAVLLIYFWFCLFLYFRGWFL